MNEPEDKTVPKRREPMYFDVKNTGISRPDGEEIWILMQNTNGPCPLVSLVNTCLFGNGQIPSAIRKYTTNKEILEVNNLLSLLSNLLLESEASNTDYIKEALACMPDVVDGLNINPRFDGTFEGTSGYAFFRAFHLNIIHGWVVDPKDETYFDVLNSIGSYDESQSFIVEASQLDPSSPKGEEVQVKSLIIQQFFENNSTQLTAYGLEYLTNTLEPDVATVFFRNDHFSTIVLHGGRLYTVVTDYGFKDRPHVIWQSLSDVNDANTTYYGKDFNVLTAKDIAIAPPHQQSLQENTEKHEDWKLAQQLQTEEDLKYAKRLQNQHQKSSKPLQKSKSRKEKSKGNCTIM